MKETRFQEYYQQVRARDEKMDNEQPLPEAEGVNVWIVFGLSFGIVSIVTGFFTKYSIIFGLAAAVLSFVGYTKKKDGPAVAGLICSCIGIIIGIATVIYRTAS